MSAVHATEHPVQAEAQRHAYNQAFQDFGLAWHWDASTHRGMLGERGGPQAVRDYLQTEQSHLLRAYDADFLVDAIEAAKQRHLRAG